MNQERIAFIIVGVAAVSVAFTFFRSTLAAPIAKLFLKRGNVKMAMKLKAQAKEAGCGSCEASPPGGKKLPAFPRSTSKAE